MLSLSNSHCLENHKSSSDHIVDYSDYLYDLLIKPKYCLWLCHQGSNEVSINLQSSSNHSNDQNLFLLNLFLNLNFLN